MRHVGKDEDGRPPALAPEARPRLAGEILEIDQVRPDVLRPQLEVGIRPVIHEMLEGRIGHGAAGDQESGGLEVHLRAAGLVVDHDLQGCKTLGHVGELPIDHLRDLIEPLLALSMGGPFASPGQHGSVALLGDQALQRITRQGHLLGGLEGRQCGTASLRRRRRIDLDVGSRRDRACPRLASGKELETHHASPSRALRALIRLR